MAANSHILAVLFPLQGHINPMVQLCKRLIAQGIGVTLVTTTSTRSTLQTQQIANLINIETVPDYTVTGDEQLDIYTTFFQNFKESISRGLPAIIQKLGSCSFPVKAILYDSISPWLLDIAHENGLKGAALFTQTCTVCSIFYHLHKGVLEIPSDECSDVSLPGLPVMGFKDLPSFVHDMNPSYISIRNHLIEQFSTFEKADWRLFNTFDELEDKILKWMANQSPILTIGPSIPSMYIDKRIQDNYEYGFSLFMQRDESCIEWLDTKEDLSVIYISFGSLANPTEKQMEELARGLIDSKYNFLWVVRNPEESKLPQDFTSNPPKKGLIVNWCNQLEVLSHRSVGCFITHCGWNSTLEALSLGVPMVVTPKWSDQTTNAKLIVDIWKTGVRVKTDENAIVTREELMSCVKEVMEGEKGREIRRNAVKWKDLAKEAISEGGTSDKNIAEFVKQLES